MTAKGPRGTSRHSRVDPPGLLCWPLRFGPARSRTRPKQERATPEKNDDRAAMVLIDKSHQFGGTSDVLRVITATTRMRI